MTCEQPETCPQPHYLAETIAEVTNLKSLEIYRCGDVDCLSFADAKSIDDHMVDLSTRIIEAISQVPEPDEYEIWLRERTCSGCSVSDLKPTENEPVKEPEQNTQVVADKPAATPKESNETSATVSPLAARPGVDNVPAPAVCGAGPGTPKPKKKNKPKKADSREFIKELKAWIKTENLTNVAAGKLAGVSDVTIYNLVTGATKNPSAKTKKKILKAINGKKKIKPLVSEKVALRTGNGTGPGMFVRIKLTAWMTKNRLGVKDAAARLGIAEQSIRSISNGFVPHENILRHMGRTIPDIGNNMHELIQQMRAAG